MKSVVAMVFLWALGSPVPAASGLTSIDTGDHTITKVRTARNQGWSDIVASSYDKTISYLSSAGKPVKTIASST